MKILFETIKDSIAGENTGVRSNGLMTRYPQLITTLHECPHKNVKRKIKHHYNHNHPFNVMVLCDRCHNRLHAAIYQWNKDPFRNQKWIESIL